MDSTTQQVMLITGTSKGLGAALRDYYLANNWSVYGCSRNAITFPHPSYTHFVVDVTDEAAVIDAVQHIENVEGHIDALINNAGIASMNHSVLTPLRTLESVFSTNVFGSFLFTREVAKVMMRQTQGRIINISSVASALALGGETAYAASKAALESMTRTQAKELAPYHITVNAVGATPIKIGLTQSVAADKIDAVIAQQAIKRWGEAADVANVIDFFLQPDSDFVTGQIVYLGGVCA